MMEYVIGNEHAPTKDTNGGMMDTMYEVLQRLFDHIGRQHMNILLLLLMLQAWGLHEVRYTPLCRKTGSDKL
jgi:hypothetical protein